MAIERWRPFGFGSRWEPFQGLSDIQHEVNRLFDSFVGRPTTVAAAERIWMPLADMYEGKDDLSVTLELPGVSEKEVSVSIASDVLTIKGERKFEKEISEQNIHRLERVYGKFERAIPLPVPVQADKAKATYRDGVLEVKLPKAEELKPKEIKVDVL